MTDALHSIDTDTDAQRSTGTWKSDASTTSSTAMRYDLDEEDTTPILKYTYGGDISTTSQKDLCQELDNDTTHAQHSRVTKKQIPRFASSLEVKRHDLYLPSERLEYSKYPNYDSSLAEIRLPSSVYWNRLLFGRYDSLYIVSPETSPENSEAGSSFGSASAVLREDSPVASS
ncbi:hypothetical protein AAFC00_001670 [Neodothiora populina]|uniref:Uncharacterized protein n=1 Tax=Neodothiora populina TaxID=2781224 RepID=A0ABR3PPR9_9PEZI